MNPILQGGYSRIPLAVLAQGLEGFGSPLPDGVTRRKGGVLTNAEYDLQPETPQFCALNDCLF